MDMDSIPCEHGIIVIRCPNCKSKGLKIPAKLRKEIEEIAKKQNANRISNGYSKEFKQYRKVITNDKNVVF
jgi:hypothetical protein